MLRARLLLFAGVTAALFLMNSASVRAADFYQGKTIAIVVGSTPGGEFDAYARLLGRHLGDHIPGRPNVIVENMPGAGSLTALRSLDVTQPTDGTVIVMFNPGLVTRSVVEPKSAGVDFRNFALIGVTTSDFRVCYGFGPNGAKSWDDMMRRKEFILGSTAKGSGNYINGATLRIVFHAPVKQVLGFPGAAQQRLAIERGELDGDCGSYSAMPPDWIADGKAHLFVRFSKTRPPGMPASAVFIEDFAKTQDERQLLDVLDAGDEIGRPFAMSNRVPPDRIAIIRQAFDATMKDPAFLADAKQAHRPIYPLTGKRAEAIVKKMLDAPPAVVAEARRIYE